MVHVQNRIVVAFDGSEHAFHAVKYVAQICSPSTHHVKLMQILPAAPEEVFRQVNMDQDSKRAGVASERISTRCRVASLSRAGEVLAEAREGGDGTIIMGRRGISKVRELVMGRVTSKVLNGADGGMVIFRSPVGTGVLVRGFQNRWSGSLLSSASEIPPLFTVTTSERKV